MKQAIPGLSQGQIGATIRLAGKQPSNEWQKLLFIICGLLKVSNQKLKWIITE